MKDELNQQMVIMATTALGFVTSLASAPTGGPEDLWDNSRLVMTCVAGSLAGAVLLMAMPHAKMTARKMACEVFFSGLTGVIFTPPVIFHFGVPRNTTYVLPTSALVAMLFLGVLRILIPALRSIFADWLLKKIINALGLQFTTTKPPTEKLEP